MTVQRSKEALERKESREIFDKTNLDNLKQQSLRGGVVTLISQGAKFVIQFGSVMILARILSPADFGLQSMVVAVMGFVGLFRDAGLGVATIQKDEITHEQTSTLFWINSAVGIVLAFCTMMMAPVLVAFYREPRLFWITIASGSAFLFNGFSAQHQAVLVRRFKFTTMAVVDFVSLAFGAVVGVIMALRGYGYWSLIGMNISGPAIAAAIVWIVMPWMPGAPRRGTGIRSMLHMGGTSTANLVVAYAGSNVEKFLLGRFWGAAPLGLYSRAYQLMNVPLTQFSASVFRVIFPTLSRLQGDANRVCRFFLKSYALIISICLPVILVCALFAREIIPLVLGPKWTDSVALLKYLTPAIFCLALINPMGWFLLSTGRALRSLQMSFLVAPVTIVGILFGLHYGPKGVAIGCSAAMTSVAIPVIIWAIKGTGMTIHDVWQALKPPIFSGVAAGIVGSLFAFLWGDSSSSLMRLVLGLTVTFGIYLLMLLFVMRQRQFYLDLFRQVTKRA